MTPSKIKINKFSQAEIKKAKTITISFELEKNRLRANLKPNKAL